MTNNRTVDPHALSDEDLDLVVGGRGETFSEDLTDTVAAAMDGQSGADLPPVENMEVLVDTTQTMDTEGGGTVTLDSYITSTTTLGETGVAIEGDSSVTVENGENTYTVTSETDAAIDEMDDGTITVSAETTLAGSGGHEMDVTTEAEISTAEGTTTADGTVTIAGQSLDATIDGTIAVTAEDNGSHTVSVEATVTGPGGNAVDVDGAVTVAADGTVETSTTTLAGGSGSITGSTTLDDDGSGYTTTLTTGGGQSATLGNR